MKDYYYILQVEQDATTDEICTAHRNLSKKFHPDLNPGDLHSQRMFKEIQEAYECLRETQRRRQYEHDFSNWLSGKQDVHVDVEVQNSIDFINKILRGYLAIVLSIVMLVSILLFLNEPASGHRELIEYIAAPIIAVLLFIYFLPAIIAWRKNHGFKKEIFILNIFCFIPAIFPFGWILLLVYSFNRINGVTGLFLALFALFGQSQYNKHNNS